MGRVSAEMEVLIQQTEDLIAENARTAQDQTGYARRKYHSYSRAARRSGLKKSD